MVVAFMNPQSSGTVTLRSSNPSDPALIDPSFLSDPFDRRTAIEAVREALDYLDMPALSDHRERIATGPRGGTDEEILVRRPIHHLIFVVCSNGERALT